MIRKYLDVLNTGSTTTKGVPVYQMISNDLGR